MKIFLHNYKIFARHALKFAGYVPHPKKPETDWIREEGTTGRFYAIIQNSKTLDIHYDLYIENRHVSCFDMPIKHNEEKRRIFRKIGWARERDLSPKEWEKLQSKYQ